MRDAAARHDHVEVRVVGHRRAPGVKDGGKADAGAEMLRVGGDLRHGLGRRLEQEVVDRSLVLEGDRRDLGRQREDDVEVSDRQKVGLTLCEPVARRCTLAPWAVPVAAGVIGDAQMAAFVTALDMAAEGGGTTVLDRRHDLQLGQAQMTSPTGAPGPSGDAEDVGDLDRGLHRLNWAKVRRRGTGRAGRAS